MCNDWARAQENRLQELLALFRRKRMIETTVATERKDSDLIEYLRIIDRLTDLL